MTPRSHRRRLRGDEGAAAVEFTLVLPLLLTLVFAVLAFGLHITYAAVAEHSVREGLREATTRKNSSGSSTYGGLTRVTDRVNSTVPGFLPVATTVECLTGSTPPTCTDATGVLQGQQVTVRVTYTVPGVTEALQLVPFVGSSLSGLSTVKRTAIGRRE